jgi:hypothetical protein
MNFYGKKFITELNVVCIKIHACDTHLRNRIVNFIVHMH